MSEDAYSFRPGGSLKLKGVAEGGIMKKKKRSKNKKREEEKEQELERQRVKELMFKEDEEGKESGGSNDRKTEAERRFEETQKRRLAERVAKMAGKTHKDRVSEFNAKLESLSEHHDIPKVGPG